MISTGTLEEHSCDIRITICNLQDSDNQGNDIADKKVMCEL